MLSVEGSAWLELILKMTSYTNLHKLFKKPIQSKGIFLYDPAALNAYNKHYKLGNNNNVLLIYSKICNPYKCYFHHQKGIFTELLLSFIALKFMHKVAHKSQVLYSLVPCTHIILSSSVMIYIYIVHVIWKSFLIVCTT